MSSRPSPPGQPGSSPDVDLTLQLPAGSQPLLTLAPLWQGPPDPAMRLGTGLVLRATRTPAGPAAVRLRVSGNQVRAEAWGSGAPVALRQLPALLGLDDDPAALQPQHPIVHELARRFAGLRMTRAGNVFEALLITVIGQKVTSFEARRSYRLLLERWGEAAPGPLGLRLPPEPVAIARLPYHAFHPLGLERRRADALRAAAAAAGQLQAIAEQRPSELGNGLRSLPGVGQWSSAEVLRLALGDPDAISLGDYNLPSLVSWALAGERRADDRRMLDLLEPYRGQRARVVQLLEAGGLYPPRRGPRLAPRSIAAI